MTAWCCFYAKIRNFCLLHRICTTFILHESWDVLLSSGTKNLVVANSSTTGWVQTSWGGLTLFADCWSPALSTLQFPFREQLHVQCLRLSKVSVRHILCRLVRNCFLRFKFRPKLKYGLHQPLHGVNEWSQTFDIHAIKQKESFQIM